MSNLESYLSPKSESKNDLLHPAYIIQSDNYEFVCSDIYEFFQRKFNINLALDSFSINESRELKNISVEQIREVNKFIYKTSDSGYKLVLISDAHNMNKNASNACLKILEDSPYGSHIFLLTNKPDLLLATIRSRCFHINLLQNTKQENNDLRELKEKLITVIKSDDAKAKWSFIEEYAKQTDIIGKLIIAFDDIIKDHILSDNLKAKNSSAKMKIENNLDLVLKKHLFIRNFLIKADELELETKALILTVLENLAAMLS